MASEPHHRRDTPVEHGGDRELLRGMWIRNTAKLVEDGGQIEAFIQAATTVRLTDVYLSVAPELYSQKGALIASFNGKVSAAGIRVWALDGRPAHIKNLTTNEPLMQGLRNLIKFNEDSPESARFHGFQADIQPQDTPVGIGDFHLGVAASKLTPLQQTERDLRMHIWLNCLTQASNFVHSYDMPFGAVIPYWLHAYNGEPVTVTWSTGKRATDKPGRTCMMDMIMPMLDQYVVRSYGTEPAETVTQIMTQVRYACDLVREGHKMPTVLGSMETAAGMDVNVSYGDTPEKADKTIVLNDLDRVESVMLKYPSFGGMVLHDWTGWSRLSS